MTTTPSPLLMASAIARKLDRPAAVINNAIRTGILVPDFRAGKYSLFRIESVEEIRAKLNGGKHV